MGILDKITKLGVALIALSMMTACSSTKSQSVQELTKNDKYMGCTELELEMTEAEFFRDRAERNRSLSVRNVVMPLGYPSTYLSAGKAIDNASNRMEYLSRLYEVKGCADQRMASAGGGYGGGYDRQVAYGGYPPAHHGDVMYQPMRYEAPRGAAMGSPVVRPMGY